MPETTVPFLSVVIPTYNRKESLRVTIEGLARQTYPPNWFEVIVISDGSTDGTADYLARRLGKVPFTLRPITQSNAGPACARNQGVKEARGQVIVFLDDDVEPLPEFLQAHASHHEHQDNVVVIGPMSPDRLRRSQEPVWIAWEHAMLEKQYSSWRTGAWAGAGPNHFYSGNASVRRSHILAVDGFDESFGRQEDVELAYRMERHCGVRFLFDANAAGLHRPSRSFASWLIIPFAYGQLDVVRARRGDASWDIVRHNYLGRSWVTRGLALLCLAYPVLSAPLRATLLVSARASYLLRIRRLSLGALSILYNLRYLEGAQAEIGASRKLRALLGQATPPSS